MTSHLEEPSAVCVDPTEIRQGIALMPCDLPLLLAIAGHHDGHHDWARSRLWAQRALAVSPRGEHAFRIVIHSLIATRQLVLAGRAFASFGSISGTPLLLDYLLVLSLSGRKGEFQHALASFHDRPVTADQLLFLARLYYSAGNDWLGVAVRALRQAVVMEPNIVGPPGRFLNVTYANCFECADHFVNLKQGEDQLQVNRKPFVATFKNVLVRPDGGIVTDNGDLILEDITPAPLMYVVNDPRVICSDAIREGIAFAAEPVNRLLLQMPRTERRIAGRAVLFGGTENFGHIVTDFLSKLSTGWPRDGIDHILLSSNCHRAATDFLRKLGFTAASILRQREDEVLRVEHLIAPSLTHRFPDLPVDYVAWLRSQFAVLPPPGAARRRLAISRRAAVGRHFANAEEMQAVYADFGIEELDFSGLSLDEQLGILASAELLLGASGAGSAGALFVAADCLVVELRDPSWVSLTGQYPRALTAMGHRYRVLECAPRHLRTPRGVDVTLDVPISDLRVLLAEELRSGSR